MYFVGKIRYKKTGVTRLEGGGGGRLNYGKE